MNSANWLLPLSLLAATALLVILIRFGANAMRAAKRPVPGAGEVGIALLFLTSGRMPPPPPQSQIEVELQGEKDRGASDTLRQLPGPTVAAELNDTSGEP